MKNPKNFKIQFLEVLPIETVRDKGEQSIERASYSFSLNSLKS